MDTFEKRYGALPLLQDVMPERAVVKLFQKGVQFILLAHQLKFDTAVRAVPDPAEHIKTLRELLCRIAESDPLDPS